MRIGLPRALTYYEYGVLWRTFFEALGAEVVVSGPTTRQTLELATSQATADLCFPAKVYAGHLLALAGLVDLIFVPSLRGTAPTALHCAKIIGLPDLARTVARDPSLILSVDVDMEKGSRALAQAAWAAARPLTWNPVQIARAADTAWASYRQSLRKPKSHPPQDEEKLTLAVVGHPYLLRDGYANHSLFQRLDRLGVRVLRPSMLSGQDLERAVEALTGEAYWAYAPSLLGTGVTFLRGGTVHGLIAVIAFGCAPDSGLAPELGRACRRAGMPMLTITLDEQSGEAGLVTRLEAFVDMLERKRLWRRT